MTKENEQKKEYLTPKMDIIEMEHNAALMEGSPEGEVETIFNR